MSDIERIKKDRKIERLIEVICLSVSVWFLMGEWLK